MHIKHYSLIGLAVSAAFAAGSTCAAETATLTVAGSLNPTSCDVTLTTPTIDFGRIAHDELNNTSPTKLPLKGGFINVTCASDTKAALQINDAKAATANNSAAIVSTIGEDASTTNLFGLGTDADGNNIGAYVVRFGRTGMARNSTSGGMVQVLSTRSVDGGATWPAHTGSSRGITPGTGRMGYNATGSGEPEAYEAFEAPISIHAAVDALDNLNTSNDIALDGNATVVIQYL